MATDFQNTGSPASVDGESAQGLKLYDLAGLTLRLRQHLAETEKETGWRKHRLEEAEQQASEWAARFLEVRGEEPPTSKQVSAKWGWWRRVWREYRSFSAGQTLMAEALPWLEAYRDHLTNTYSE